MRPNAALRRQEATALRRKEADLGKAVTAIQRGESVRVAARRHHVAKSTVFDRLVARQRKRQLSRTAFTDAEENRLVDFVVPSRDLGVPLNREHLIEEAAIFIDTLPSHRQIKLPFKNGRPGVCWVRDFYCRHIDRLKYAVPFWQEHKRYAAANAETLTIHLATLNALYKKYGFDARYVWNLDETGVSPGKDRMGSARERVLVRREAAPEKRALTFSYKERITLMPVFSAAGYIGPALWIFKVTRLPSRDVLINEQRHVQTLNTFLSPGALVRMEPKSAGVNADSFYQWAHRFTASKAHLVADGRKLLLTYDGYRSHMTLRVLLHLCEHAVVVYALPAHTSGKTQPCDTGAFRGFKDELNKTVGKFSQKPDGTPFNIYETCAMLITFSAGTIMSAFSKSVVWPLDPNKLLGVPRPHDSNDLRTLTSVANLRAMYEERCEEAARRILGEEVVVVRRGFVDTTRGLVLPTDAALAAALSQADAWRVKNKFVP